ncbi:MAG: hypothetical protein KGI68_11575 [Alphaproteobacteria bacterium]|nr:hypothetical protein [Alphaproteobacteria bacterium]MDE2162637.1 hypothetical protein [Alphaproteobacteria bacterium]MDE2265635.1 hypothetical protein [Alphaproteobacteria bacterium]MDE2499553.1 hypothetical protein [Alphaproteobacteria bacterium]
MTAKTAERAKVWGASSRIFSTLILVAGLGLSGCADVDNMLFGDSGTAPDNTQTSAAPDTTAPAPGSMPMTSASMSSGTVAPVATITPVPIEPGSDTGTAVSKTIASLRAQVSALQNSLMQNAQRLADLRNAGADSASAYHEAKARITTRLQVGTTRGNPELVSQWNTAQAALDQLTGNINGLNALGTSVADDSSKAHYALDQITATFNVSGAVDEDHRQLSVLQDETNQTIVLIDRLLTEVSGDIQRQTAYVANERANLTVLASAIKNGELYGADLGAPMMSSSAASSTFGYSGTPLVVIRFDHSDVDYQQILYAALSQALQSRPGAGFSIVAVSPTRGTATAVQLAQTAAHNHAQEVLRSMTDMGVPATRMTIASATDPSATSSEVRVYVR